MDSWKQKFDTANRLESRKKYIWEEEIDIETTKVDIWKGCPDFAPPDAIMKALTEVSTNGNAMIHQYTKGTGHPRFTLALSKLYSILAHHQLDPSDDILITVGIYGAVYSTIFGNIVKNDEVIIVEPFSDFYDVAVRSAGGKSIFIPLRLQSDSANFGLDFGELEALFNNKTKMIIIDTPNTHLGKIYTKDELEKISKLCNKWNVMCVAIESDEFLIYKSEKEYTRVSTLPEMKQRTVTIGSGDTTFFLKGWKVAWAYGPSYLIINSQISHLNSINVCTTVLQEALAVVFEDEIPKLNTNDSYFTSVAADLCNKKEIMFDILRSTGLKPIVPDSGIFMVADWSALEHKIMSDLGMKLPDDFDFVKWFLNKSGIQTVPLSMFYSDEHSSTVKTIVRFCFNKKPETLLKAKELLQKFTTKLT